MAIQKDDPKECDVSVRSDAKESIMNLSPCLFSYVLLPVSTAPIYMMANRHIQTNGKVNDDFIEEKIKSLSRNVCIAT